MGCIALGVDIAKAKFDVALLINCKFKTKVFSNDHSGFQKLLIWLEKQGATTAHVCLESTGRYGEGLSNYLYQKGCNISVVNPARIKAFGQSELIRNKTDKLDAKIIAKFCSLLVPSFWHPIPLHVAKMRELLRRLENFKSMQLEEKNRLEMAPEYTKDSIVRMVKHLDIEIKIVEKDLDEHIALHEDLKAKCKLLGSIPGVGKITSHYAVAFYGEPEKFSGCKQLVAYLGLNPKHKQSGSSVRGKARMSKMGSTHLRKMLYMPAIVSKKNNPPIKALYDRLLAAGKPKKVAIGAAMRKLVHIIYGVLKSGRPFDINLAHN